MLYFFILWYLKEIICLNDMLENNNKGLNCFVCSLIFIIENSLIFKVVGIKKLFYGKILRYFDVFLIIYNNLIFFI